MVQKIVVNRCYGGFSISEKAIYKMAELKGITIYKEDGRFPTYWTIPEKPNGIVPDDKWGEATMEARKKSNRLYNEYTLDNRPEKRDDPDLVMVVELLGSEANGECAKLEVIEVPDGVEWEIEEYDGREWVSEKHRIW